jgi:aspartate/methionine/tyrosine aminotransferase
VNFAAFQLWREQSLRAETEVLDCAETNLYQSLGSLRPQPEPGTERKVHRCDLARAWLGRYGFTECNSRRALVCRGVRHALGLIFRELAVDDTVLWIPSDVYPVYLELARAVGVEPRLFTTLPTPKLPANRADGRVEYLLLTNPWKPLGRFLTERECADLIAWLGASSHRYLLMDCVYDLGAPFHLTTQKLLETGRAILLHSVTKGWLWPKTFGVALLCEEQKQLEWVFRNDPPSQDQLRLAEKLFSGVAHVPGEVVAALHARKRELLAGLSALVRRSFLIDPECAAPGCYLFPVRLSAEELLQQHRILAIPASAFGADWDGSILTSLAGNLAAHARGGAR